MHLVTGGSGFLGSLIARRLLQKGEKVRVLDVWDDPARPKDAEFVRCDIRDRLGVREAMRGVRVVHHNAALVPLTKAGDDFREVNVTGSSIAAEEAVKAGVGSFVHMSSSAVFGAPDACPITPQTPLRPVEAYGSAKLAGEQAVRRVCEKAGLPLYVIRPRTIVGQGRMGIFRLLFEWIHEGRAIYIIGDGRNAFQFVHAADLIDAYSLVLERGAPGTYNVGTDRFGTVREAIENLARAVGSPSRVVGLPVLPSMLALRTLDLLRLSPLAPWHYLTYHKPFVFDLKPLLELGWSAKYSNDELMRESYEWFLAHRSPAEETGSPHRRRVNERLLWLLRKLS